METPEKTDVPQAIEETPWHRSEASDLLLKASEPPQQRAFQSSAATDGQGWRSQVAGFGSSFAAGVLGTVTWSLLGKTRVGLPAKLAATTLASGTVKVGVKGFTEALLVEPEQRSLSYRDFAWGAVDGFAAVGGSMVESRIKGALTGQIRRAAGSGWGKSVAADLPFDMATSFGQQLRAGVMRGAGGGAAVGFAWSLPRSLYEHRDELKTMDGWHGVMKDVSVGAGSGAILGAGIFAGSVTFANRAQAGRYIAENWQSQSATFDAIRRRKI